MHTAGRLLGTALSLLTMFFVGGAVLIFSGPWMGRHTYGPIDWLLALVVGWIVFYVGGRIVTRLR